MGLATRGGCNETCLNINIPCRGCFGPVEGVKDAGAKYLSAITSVFNADEEETLKKIVDSLDDPAGYFYRFSLPTSMLENKLS